MAERIEGLPGDLRTNDRVAYLVGKRDNGNLELLRTEVLDRIVRGLSDVARAFNLGHKVRDLILFNINGAILNGSLGGTLDQPLLHAQYRNAGTVQINVRLKMDGGRLSQGEMLLGPGATVPVGLHSGFQARTPSSAPSFLEVTPLE